MYEILSRISQTISDPLNTIVNSFADVPIIYAIILGLIGAVAPCQLTGNLSTITLYGNRTIQMKSNWVEIMLFLIGKIVVFSTLGFLAWSFGQSFEVKMTEYFPLFRKFIGPIIILTGFVLLGILKLRFLQRIIIIIPMKLKEGKLGSFLMGVSFSLAFCPTMFVIFFIWLMPAVATTSYGLVLPAVFGVATSLPLLFLFFLIWFFDAKRLIMKRSMTFGRIIQRLAGIILILVGVSDTFTFWTI